MSIILQTTATTNSAGSVLGTEFPSISVHLFGLELGGVCRALLCLLVCGFCLGSLLLCLLLLGGELGGQSKRGDLTLQLVRTGLQSATSQS